MNPSNTQIPESKLVSFAIGQQKKSRFQKAREDKEAKQKLEDEATAKVYDSFVSSFTEEEDGKTFVRGASSRGDQDSIYGGNRGEVYKMDRNAAGGSEIDKVANEMKDREAERPGRSSAAVGSGTTKGKRQIDDFLSEIMNRQESQSQQSSSSSDNGRYGERDRDRDRDRERGHNEGGNVMSTSLNGGYIEKGSYDNGDPTTTNLYLGNLAPTTTEEHLLDLFGKYGEINSVKIMWPRSEEEKARKRNCGFVSFKLRADAEDALIELQDSDLEGYKMILGWGKAVKISAAPFILPPSLRSAVAPPVPMANTFPAPGAPPHLLPPPPSGGPFVPGMLHAPPPPFQQSLPPPPMGHHVPPFPPAFPPAAPGSMNVMGQGPPSFGHPGFLPPPPQGLARPPMPPFALPPGMHTAPSGVTETNAVQQPPRNSAVSVPAVEDLTSMSVDNFLDSIVASAKPSGAPSVAPAGSLPGSVAVASRWAEGASRATSASVPQVALPPLPASLPLPPHLQTQAHTQAQHHPLPAFRPPPPTSLTASHTTTADYNNGAPPSMPSTALASNSFSQPAPSSSVAAATSLTSAAPNPAPAATVLPVDLTITLPEDPERQALIDLVAKFTAADGDAFEKNLKVREEGNPIYAFLFDLECQEGQYYRWRTFAFAWGDTVQRWHDQPLQWSVGGLVIAPPFCPEAKKLVEENGVNAGICGGGGGEKKSSDGKERERRRKRSRSPSHERPHRDRRSLSRSPSPERRHHSHHSHHNNNTNNNHDTRRRAGSFSRRSRSRSHSRDRPHREDRHTQRDRDRGGDREAERWERGRDPDHHHHSSHHSNHHSNHQNSHKPRRDGGSAQSAEAKAADRSRYATMTGAQIERERTKQRQLELARLSKEDYQEWKRKLGALDLSRDSIKQAMGFAFDKIESAEEIVSMVKDKLILPSSYGAVKMAGLYLLSDILHNAGAPVKHASAYRSLVQGVLPEIFENLAVLFHSTSGRMSAFNIEDRVKKLFSVWAEWSVFPAMYLIGLQATFHFTEADRAAMAAYMSEQAEQDALDGIDLLSDPSVAEKEALETLRKRARMQGVHYTDKTSKYELQFKIDYGEKFSQTRYGQSNVSSISTLLTPYESLHDVSLSSHVNHPYKRDDIYHSAEKPSVLVTSTTGLTPLEQMLQGDAEEEYDDDIDGVPMEIGEYSIPESSAPPPSVSK